jgi:hypothetical protein
MKMVAGITAVSVIQDSGFISVKIPSRRRAIANQKQNRIIVPSDVIWIIRFVGRDRLKILLMMAIFNAFPALR